MTPEIALVLIILITAIVFFVTELLRVDVVALLVLSALVVTGLVNPEEALSGFSNPAVVTVWAVFILSGGLAQTGVADIIGRQVLRLAGAGYVSLLLVLMITAGLLSAFMNNIGVVAMFLPVILDISRQTGYTPSRLLLPTVFAAMLGGTLTLIGTPANILLSESLAEAGLEPLSFFDFTPVGLAVLGCGILFMALSAKRLLPIYAPVRSQAAAAPRNSRSQFGLEERLALITLPAGTPLAGVTLAESRIGEALGLNILAIRRGKQEEMAPNPATRLYESDQLLVLGRLDRLDMLLQRSNLIPAAQPASLAEILRGDAALAEFTISQESSFLGRTLAELNVRREYDLNVLAVLRDGQTITRNLQNLTARAGDRVLLFGSRAEMARYQESSHFRIVDQRTATSYQLEDFLLTVQIDEQSPLAGTSLRESRLANTFGLNALCIVREGQSIVLPDPDLELNAGDTLIVTGHPRDLEIVRGLQGLHVDRRPDIDLESLESESVTLAEAMLSPFTTLTNKTLREMRFREKYDLSVLAVWRGGRPYRTDLGNLELRLGDALLIFGPREKVKILAQEPDFLVLDSAMQKEPDRAKAPVASLLMVGVVLVALLGWLPISVAAVIGATLMVVTGCLSIDEAYRYIEWKAVFLIAAMLPLGIAMEQTGAAGYLATTMISAVGDYGPYALMAGIFVLAVAAAQFIPNPVVAVLLAPIALTAALEAGLSPYPFAMALVVAASSSFLVPVGHPANVLVMGPGGYRFGDYPRAGLPLTLVMLLATLLVVPILWPF